MPTNQGRLHKSELKLERKVSFLGVQIGEGHSKQREIYLRAQKEKRCSWNMKKEKKDIWYHFLFFFLSFFFLRLGLTM
jgi:hypothetical protein